MADGGQRIGGRRRSALVGGVVVVALVLALTACEPTEPSGGLAAVDCPTTNVCFAVGYTARLDAGNYGPLIERWNGSRWSVMANTGSLATLAAQVLGISCATTTSCAAIGMNFTAKGGVRPVILRWDGRRWGTSPVPLPAGTASADDVLLSSISCPSATFCLAVGYRTNEDETNDLTFAETWDGQRWKLVDLGLSAKQYVLGASCPSVTSCLAVGVQVLKGGFERMLARRWDGMTWTAADPPAVAGVRDDVLRTVSCPATGGCMAIGQYGSEQTGNFGIRAARWDGSAWTASAVTQVSSSTPFAGAISCPSDRSCTLIGGDLDQANYRLDPVAFQWNGSTWARNTPKALAASLATVLSGIDCPTSAGCFAVGYSSGKVGELRPLVEHSHGSSWSILPSPSLQ